MATTSLANSDHVLEYCIKQRDKCQQLVKESKGTPHHGLANKALMSAELSVGLLQVKEVDKAKALTQALQKYMQSILDQTYFQECCLVDKDFPEDSVMKDAQELLDQFSTGINVCGSTYSQLVDILGDEVIECIHWRIGALMYMIAHTIMNTKSRRDTVNKEWLSQCCHVGVCHLRKVFEVRTILATDDQYTTNDTRVPQLLKHGIRSDTHMLALAYGGELSYWYQLNLSNNDTSVAQYYTELFKVMETIHDKDTVEELRHMKESILSMGVEFLQLYIEVAKGSLSMQSWQCERSEEVLLQLKRILKQ